MKFIKKLLCLVLFASLSLSNALCVFAQEEKVQISDEKSNMNFSDVSETDWFYNDLLHLYDLSVVDGYPDGTFLPKGEVTRAEFLKMLVCAALTPQNTDISFDDVEKDDWFAEYISNAAFESIIISNEEKKFRPNDPITRLECARYIYRALELNYCISDTPYNDTSDIYALSVYNEYIMQGSVDIYGERNFYPESNLSRCEAVAVISRVISYIQDKETFILSEQEAHPECVQLSFIRTPKSFDDFYYAYLYAWENGMEKISFEYAGVPYNSKEMNAILENCSKAFTFASNHHPELAFMQKLSYTKSGNHNATKLTFSFSPSTEEGFEQMIQKSVLARQKALEISERILAGCENDKEKLLAIHSFLAKNISYGDVDDADAYTLYGALVNKSAVCQGFSAAFNLLCKLAGIDSYSVSNEVHMWNTAVLEGKVLFFDSTFESANYAAFGEQMKNMYFALSFEDIHKEGYAAGVWDEWDYGFEYYR